MAHIFISYSRSDSWPMRGIRYFLVSQGFRVWVDDEGVRVGEPDFRPELWRALEEAGCLIVVCSPDARKSKWVQQEIDRATGHGLQLFPLLVRGNTDNAKPVGVEWATYVDLRVHFQIGMHNLIAAIDNNPKVANVRRSGSSSWSEEDLRWHRVGSVFWFASEARKLRLQLAEGSTSEEELRRGLIQLRHHATRLEVDRYVTREIDMIVEALRKATGTGWSREDRTYYADRLRVAFDTVARKAENHDPDFTPGPRWE